jgi:hypothetical protein
MTMEPFNDLETMNPSTLVGLSRHLNKVHSPRLGDQFLQLQGPLSISTTTSPRRIPLINNMATS